MDFDEIQNIAIRMNNNIDPFSDESSWPILRKTTGSRLHS